MKLQSSSAAVAAALTLALAGSSQAADRPILEPGWRAARDLSDFVPERAARMEVSGWARLRCSVADNGDARDCIVVGENPVGYDFGEAALRIIQWGRFEPTAQGEPTTGRVVIKKIALFVGNGTAPDEWAERATASDIARAHPKEADGYGMADVGCRTVSADGRLGDCSIQSESPAGQGFGAAALGLAAAYRFKGVHPAVLKVGFWINWMAPGSTAMIPGYKFDLAQPRPPATPLRVEPFVMVFDRARPGGVAGSQAEMFVAKPDEVHIEGARPAGLSGVASVYMYCDVTPAGALANCTASPDGSTDPRYVAAATSLLPFYTYSPAGMAAFQAEPVASYHVNWEP